MFQIVYKYMNDLGAKYGNECLFVFCRLINVLKLKGFFYIMVSSLTTDHDAIQK